MKRVFKELGDALISYLSENLVGLPPIAVNQNFIDEYLYKISFLAGSAQLAVLAVFDQTGVLPLPPPTPPLITYISITNIISHMACQ